MKQLKRIILAMVLVVWAATADATTLKYRAYGRGFHIMDIETEYDLNKNDYAVLTHAQSKGPLNLFMKRTESYYYSAGRRRGADFIIDLSTTKKIQKKKELFNAVDFTGTRDMLDYSTAVLKLITQARPHNTTIRLQDAKREMTATLTYQGTTTPDQKVKVQAKDWFFYTLSLTVNRGKTKGWFFRRLDNDKNPPVRLYFARVQDVPELVPVKIEMDSGFWGTIRVYLTDITPDSMP